ncbi:MAG: radical SAM protein [Myxococcales bacterium]|nr:radical SAM protein [Myxococcales bacterium]MCB9650264.1 radical SAM protein [Deltaproteobacteria bacterium]
MELVTLPSLMPTPTGAFPEVPLLALDTLWFQVSGTICNLRCQHCFISCGPDNHRLGMMSLEQVLGYLEEARDLGVREYYFTGGEPFMNRELVPMLAQALAQGPTSVLTNGVLIKAETAAKLRGLQDGSEYSFDLRISMDGYDAATNDPIRGAGTFERIMQGILRLAEAGLNPVITVTEALPDAQTREGRGRFLEFLRRAGLTQPRLKILPLLRMGAEAGRQRGYAPWESLAGAHLTEDELRALQCSSCRMVSAVGVHVCPILVDDPVGGMGRRLKDSLRPFALAHPACYTCKVDGLSCTT